jgi:heme-degrading monooxygenase HmoA
VPTSPWKQFAEMQPDREYLVLASYLPLTSFNRTPYMLRHARTVRGALANAPGLVGYSMKAKVPSKRYWTLSVWEDEAALHAFVGRSPHVDVMALLKPDMDATKFERWTVAGTDPLPTWDEALRRLA